MTDTPRNERGLFLKAALREEIRRFADLNRIDDGEAYSEAWTQLADMIRDGGGEIVGVNVTVRFGRDAEGRARV